MKKDVIISVYASSAQAPNQKWAKEYFTDEPIVLVMPGGGGGDFRARMQSWIKTGDVHRAALNQLAPQHKDTEIGRRGLVTFSVGWSAGEEFFKSDLELSRLDAYLLVDGMHNDKGYLPWQKFASRAAAMEALMIMCHSSIKPPFVSSTVSNKAIFDKACEMNDSMVDKPRVETALPDYFLNAQLPDEGVTIKLAGSPGLAPVSKHWTKDPILDYQSRGNLYRIGYSGNDRPDHCYICWDVQPRMWRLLGETWNS